MKIIKKYFKTVIKSIGIFLLVFLIYRIGPTKIFSSFHKINIFIFLIAIILLIISNLLKSVRWRIICSGYDINIGKLYAAKAYMVGTFYGIITPGYIGDFGKVTFLTKKKVEITTGFNTVIFDRIFDLLLLFILVFFSSIYLEYRYNILDIINFSLNKFLIILILTIFVSILIFFFLKKKTEFKFKIITNIKRFLEIKLNKRKLILAGLFTLFAASLGYGAFIIIAHALGITIPIFDIISYAAFISFIQFVPISVLGIGTRDLTLVYFFKLNGLPPELAVTLSFLILCANIGGILPGFVLFLREKL